MSRRTFKIPTTEVFKAIESERDYQESRWNPNTTTSSGVHSIEEYIMYMEDYLAEAKHLLSRNARQDSDGPCLDIMRKVTAMGVVCMEQNGAPQRKGFER